MSDIAAKFEGKKVLLWGYGREGKASFEFLEKYSHPSSVDIFEGALDALPKDEYDFIIKSPGVPYIYTNEPKMTSMTELFLEEFRDQTIGITGTKGKSTTTSMLYQVLNDNLSKKVCLLGNIGIPSIEAYEDMKNGAIAVYEMSCHQLANNIVSPHISVFLNLFEDHLDYYGTRDKYFEAKAHIAMYQGTSDYLITGENVPYIDTKAQIIKVPYITNHKYSLSILGEHNQQNAEVVYWIATNIFGCDSDKVLRSLEEFKGLPHRLEYFATIDGVNFYDDSISTIPEATINAFESVPDPKTVIVGGMDRGIDYDILIDAIKDRQDINFILCYSSGERIYKEVNKLCNVILVSNLDDAVKKARIITKNGDCILSPAAASYGYFKNFEERGEYFKGLIKGV